MRRLLGALAVLTVASSASAVAATAASIPVSGPATTAAVATFELLDGQAQTWRSVSARHGVHFTLCSRGSLRPCSLSRGAEAARRQAFGLALATLRSTDADVVVVALPQSPTRHVVLVFERDLITSPELDPLTATADRLYAMGGLVGYSATEDSLLLVRLRPSAVARTGR